MSKIAKITKKHSERSVSRCAFALRVMQFPWIDFLKTDFISFYLRNLTAFISNKFKQQKVY